MQQIVQQFKKIDWKQILVILAAAGVIGSSNPDDVLISIGAVVVVAFINLASKATGKPVGRGWVSLIVYALAFGLAIAANPPAAVIPVWNGDPAAYTEQLAALLAAFGPQALALTGSATIIYNALSRSVFAYLEKKFLQ